MKRTFFPLLLLIFAANAWAQNKEQGRLHESATVLKEILGMPDGIPKDLLNKADCVAVFPSVKKFAIVGDERERREFGSYQQSQAGCGCRRCRRA